MGRRLRMNRKGEATEEGTSSVMWLVLAVVAVTLSLTIFGKLFLSLFREEPNIIDSYMSSNFQRILPEIKNMLDYGDDYQTWVTPHILKINPIVTIAYGGGYHLVGINPDLPKTEAVIPGSTCDKGSFDVPDACKKQNCLCLCKNLVCTKRDWCKVFPGVRFIGIKQDDNVGKTLDIPDPLDHESGYEIHQLALSSTCVDPPRLPTTPWETMNLYIEESIDNKQKYILIAEESDATKKREEAILRGGAPSVNGPSQQVPSGVGH